MEESPLKTSASNLIFLWISSQQKGVSEIGALSHKEPMLKFQGNISLPCEPRNCSANLHVYWYLRLVLVAWIVQANQQAYRAKGLAPSEAVTQPAVCLYRGWLRDMWLLM